MHARTTKDSVASPRASRHTWLGWSLLAMCLGLFACRVKEKFPPLGTTIASPVDIATSDDGKHFFVLNSDFDNTYDVGSVLVLDRDGHKLNAIEVPRMGRSLALLGNTLMVTVDYQKDPTDDNYPPHVMLFDVSDPEHPQKRQDWILDCSPINGVMHAPYIAVSCANGTLMVGNLTTDLSQSTLFKVRQFSATFRALYIDTKQNLLLGFPTDLGRPDHSDAELVDNMSYTTDRSPIGTAGANEVPDQMENSPRQQANLAQRQSFQFFVYDLAKEGQSRATTPPDCPVGTTTPGCIFPFRDGSDTVVQGEMRWIYFNLNNFDGAPDQSDHFNDPAFKFYRTNFYTAQPDPDNSAVFYLSHRGSPDRSRWANQIVRVTMKGDLHSKLGPGGTYTFPTTASTMSFERVYGFKGAEATKFVYPSDFRVRRVNGLKTIVVNNSRDLVNWVRSDSYFSLGAQIIDQPDWFAEQVGGLSPQDDIRSYNQVVLNVDGRGASCSYYGNSVVIFDVVPGVGLNIVNPVK